MIGIEDVYVSDANDPEDNHEQGSQTDNFTETNRKIIELIVSDKFAT